MKCELYQKHKISRFQDITKLVIELKQLAHIIPYPRRSDFRDRNGPDIVSRQVRQIADGTVCCR